MVLVMLFLLFLLLLFLNFQFKNITIEKQQKHYNGKTTPTPFVCFKFNGIVFTVFVVVVFKFSI